MSDPFENQRKLMKAVQKAVEENGGHLQNMTFMPYIEVGEEEDIITIMLAVDPSFFKSDEENEQKSFDDEFAEMVAGLSFETGTVQKDDNAVSKSKQKIKTIKDELDDWFND